MWKAFQLQILRMKSSLKGSGANDSDIDETLKSRHQSIMRKIKNYACKDWIVLDVIIKHSIQIFEC